MRLNTALFFIWNLLVGIYFLAGIFFPAETNYFVLYNAIPILFIELLMASVVSVLFFAIPSAKLEKGVALIISIGVLCLVILFFLIVVLYLSLAFFSIVLFLFFLMALSSKIVMLKSGQGEKTFDIFRITMLAILAGIFIGGFFGFLLMPSLSSQAMAFQQKLSDPSLTLMSSWIASIPDLIFFAFFCFGYYASLAFLGLVPKHKLLKALSKLP